MREVGPGYMYFDVYAFLRDKVIALAPPGLERIVGTTCHYDLPDFRLCRAGVRIIGIHPRPKGVELLLEFSKFLDHREHHDPQQVDAFENAMGALPLMKNRLLSIQSREDIETTYLDTYLREGMALLLAEIKRRHPAPGPGSRAAR